LIWEIHSQEMRLLLIEKNPVGQIVVKERPVNEF
jgi:predicted acetyltransferase